MGIHSGPKNGDYATYVELLTRGEPGKVARGKAENAAWSLEADIPEVPHGLDNGGDPLGSAADMDAARGTRDMLRAGREQRNIRAQQAPSSGALNDMTFGRQPDLPAPRTAPPVPLPGEPPASGWKRAPGHPGSNPVALGMQRIVGLLFTLIGVSIVAIGAVTTLMVLLAGANVAAGVFPALFLVAFGAVLIRISRGLRRQAIAPQGIVPPLTTVSSRSTRA